MSRRMATWLAMLLATVGASSLRAQEVTRLDLRWSPVIALHFHARAAADAETQVPSELAALIESVKKVNEALGSDLLSWGLIEGSLYDCVTSADLRAAFEKLPETFTVRSPRSKPGEAGKEIVLRRLALDLADGLARAEVSYTATTAVEHQRLVDNARGTIARRLGTDEAKCLRYMIDHLGPEDPKATIPVYLVPGMPSPGAVTQLRPGRVGGVCFVAVRDVEPLQLVETVLHEATHALDVVWSDTSVLDQLRAKLQAAGASITPRDLRDVPHTLMFVHAGETVRRNIDASHRHYGDVSGYYARLPRATQAVRGTWVEYLDGKLAREEAINGIVQSLRPMTGSP